MVCLRGPVFIDKTIDSCSCRVASVLMEEAAHPHIHFIHLTSIYWMPVCVWHVGRHEDKINILSHGTFSLMGKTAKYRNNSDV